MATKKKATVTGTGKATSTGKVQPQTQPAQDVKAAHGKQAPGKAEAYKIWEEKRDTLDAAKIAELLMKEAPSISKATAFAWQSHWRAGNRIPKAVLAEKTAAKARRKSSFKPKNEKPAATPKKPKAQKITPEVQNG